MGAKPPMPWRDMLRRECMFPADPKLASFVNKIKQSAGHNGFSVRIDVLRTAYARFCAGFCGDNF